MYTHSIVDKFDELMIGNKEDFPHLNLPDIYFEQTNHTFKCSSMTVKRSGGLSTNWTTTCLTRVEQGYMGLYLAWDLHKQPHYMLLRTKRRDEVALSQKRNVPLVSIPVGSNLP
mmetsp:Transcript_17362/g.26537  ORF Transcript_17362/g.26537 Transcript_17362/m.26537 type:complete len:114 (-) Transcript_17362:66-407(-)